MATLTVQASSHTAQNDLTFSAATATTGDQWVNTGKELVIVINASGSPITVTIPTPVTSDGLAVADRTITVGAGKHGWLGTFPRGVYSDVNDDNKAKIVCSAVTSVTIAVVKVAN